MKASQLISQRSFEFIDTSKPEPEDCRPKIRIETASVYGSDIHGQFEDVQMACDMYADRLHRVVKVAISVQQAF